MKYNVYRIIQNNNFQLLLTLLTIIVSGGVVFLQSKVDPMLIFTGTLFLFLVCTFSIIVYAGYSHTRDEEKYFDKIEQITEFINANGMGSIVCEKEIAEIEKSSEQIWVVTPKLTSEIDVNSSIHEAFKANLSRDIEYVYFMPDDDQSIQSIQELLDIFGKESLTKKMNISFCLLKKVEFNFVSEIVIYNAETKKTTHSFQMLPNKLKKYYIEFDINHTRNTVGMLKELKRNRLWSLHDTWKFVNRRKA